MTHKVKVYLRNTMVITLILEIVFFGFIISVNPVIQAAINEPVTEEYYDLLKDNALNVAKTLDKSVITDETLTTDLYLSENHLVITVESIKAKVTARIPISSHSLNAENGTIASHLIVDFKIDDVEYAIENKLYPAWWYIVTFVIMILVSNILLYGLFILIGKIHQKIINH